MLLIFVDVLQDFKFPPVKPDAFTINASVDFDGIGIDKKLPQHLAAALRTIQDPGIDGLLFVETVDAPVPLPDGRLRHPDNFGVERLILADKDAGYLVAGRKHPLAIETFLQGDPFLIQLTQGRSAMRAYKSLFCFFLRRLRRKHRHERLVLISVRDLLGAFRLHPRLRRQQTGCLKLL